MIRLAKFIASAGYCSRRAACRLIESGAVRVNGKTACHTVKVTRQDSVSINGNKLEPTTEKVYLLYNKPTGIDCVCNNSDNDSIIHQIQCKYRVFPVGRLDKDSHGLMLLTNDGTLCHRIIHPNYFHEKEYLVKVDHPINSVFCQQMAEGVTYKKIKTRPCQVYQRGKNSFSITLTQGLNRQIRHMCKAFGRNVVDLQRTRLANLSLNDLPLNTYRKLEPKEQLLLKAYCCITPVNC